MSSAKLPYHLSGAEHVPSHILMSHVILLSIGPSQFSICCQRVELPKFVVKVYAPHLIVRLFVAKYNISRRILDVLAHIHPCSQLQIRILDSRLPRSQDPGPWEDRLSDPTVQLLQWSSTAETKIILTFHPCSASVRPLRGSLSHRG